MIVSQYNILIISVLSNFFIMHYGLTDTKFNERDLSLIQNQLNKNIRLIYTVEEYFDYLENHRDE